MNESESLTNELQNIANGKEVLILSFVAPDRSVRVSPVGMVYVSIDIDDLYAIEKVVEDLEEAGKLPKKLHLVIQTPGGLVDVSTKIAKYLRSTFEEIHAFVPYSASSGGTVLCLAANKITMGKMANLTPIDPQVPYEGHRVSANSLQKTVNDFQEKFGKKRPAEIAPPYQQMHDRLDPVMLTEMNKIWRDTAAVAISLLEEAYAPKNKEEKDVLTVTALTLTFSNSPHGHLIDAQEAADIGLRIDVEEESINLLKTYKKWIKSMLGEEQVTHVIKHFSPEVKTKTERKNSNVSEEGKANAKA
jgi:hypothetical protein